MNRKETHPTKQCINCDFHSIMVLLFLDIYFMHYKTDDYTIYDDCNTTYWHKYSSDHWTKLASHCEVKANAIV